VPDTYALYRSMSAKPLGRRAFSVMFARKAPYFRTVRPQVRELRPHHAELTIRKRRAVQNHLGTLHAIAVCNGLEAAMGLLAEATTPKDRRWIPKGMQVSYLAKSTTDLLCVAETEPADWEQVGDVPVRVRAVRTDGVVVVEGVITIYVSEKPAR
jgi:acyl-coenzyme A thioesterase PaaI-like protein